jgi:chromosome segregation ATPase
VNWELIIAIAALVTGGGCIIWIFQAGRWQGETNTKLETLRTDLEKAITEIPHKVKSETGTTSAELNNAVVKAQDQLRGEFVAGMTRIHERLDVLQQIESRLDVFVAGLQSQRQEWDTLRGDIRALLRSEATTTNEIANFKERLFAFEKKSSDYMEKVVRLESDVAHIISDRKGKG